MEHQTLGQQVTSAQRTSISYCRLTDFWSSINFSFVGLPIYISIFLPMPFGFYIKAYEKVALSKCLSRLRTVELNMNCLVLLSNHLVKPGLYFISIPDG